MLKLFKRPDRGERGQALPLTLVALAMGTLLLVPLLGQASTTLLSSRQYIQSMIEQYSSGAGIEHVMWRLKYETGFADSLNAQNPSTNYPVTINSIGVNITVTWSIVEPPPHPPPPPEGPQADRVQVSKSVQPVVAPVGQPTNFTYTIYVKNVYTSTVHLAEVTDLLPAGFAYVSGSSSGITTADPTIELEDGQQRLRWIFSSPKPGIESQTVATQVFRAVATLMEDIYWNEAWADMEPSGVGTVGTGSTAPVGGGLSPYAYDIVSNASATTISARTTITDTGVSVLSWQVQ